MIQFKNWKLYSQLVTGVRFPPNQTKPYALIYFSENSSFIEDYPKINLKRLDARVVLVPTTKIPRTRLTPDLKKEYKELGLYAFNTNVKLPQNRNIILDLSTYLKAMDEKYKLKGYRQRGALFINDILSNIDRVFPAEYERVLMYSIDITKPFNNFIDRKIFPILLNLKRDQYNYNNLMFTLINEVECRHRLLMKNGIFQLPRITQYMRSLQSSDDDIEIENENLINKAAQFIVNRISQDIDGNNIQKYVAALSVLFTKDKESLNKVVAGTVNDADISNIASTAIIFQNTNDFAKAKLMASKIPKGKEKIALKVIDKNYADELLQPKQTIDNSTQIFSNLIDIPDIIDNKSPEHLFEKRQVDFDKNLKKDLTNSFSFLATKDIPLKFNSIITTDKKTKPGEIAKSDLAVVTVSLKDKFGKLHEIQIEIPKIDPASGTFRINGRKKCLINQIVQCPITFPKPYDSKFESSYSAFHIWSKQIKKPYLEIYMGSYKGPLFPILAFSFGFDATLKKYGIDYTITTEKPDKDAIFTKLTDTDYIVFDKVDNLAKEQLIQSLLMFRLSTLGTKGDIGSLDYWRKAINKYTGRINSSYLINNNLENIVDPVAKQVLVNMQLPQNLEDIMHYMSQKVVTGFTIDRNDLGNQRIRNSEVLVHLIQKQILAAYTEYKEQVLSGNENAIFTLSPTKVLSEFINSEIVTDMEYANPLEEMSTMSRVSPVGSSVGGIPDKRAINTDARNVHPSYFGNIDPLDTPEGGNIGVIQQLTIDAYITSARGLFNTKAISDSEKSGALSTSSAMIPFIENNDGNRVMFGCAQGKQAIPLKNPEPPIVRSGYESILTNVLSDSFVKRSPVDGIVERITDRLIFIQDNVTKHRVGITPEHLKSGSGKDTLSVFAPVVKEKQRVKKGQIIAEGSCIEQGMISMGRTVLAAVMPYKGYNFEDGIVISDRLARENALTSLHGIEEEVEISAKDRIVKIVSEGVHTEKGEPLLIKTIGEVEELIGFEDIDDEESIEIYAGQFIQKSPGGRVVEIEVFSNLADSTFPKLAELSNKTKKKYGISGKEKWSIKGNTIKGVMIRFRIEQELVIGLGDKLTNRYGGKGIISLIEKEEDMPRCYDEKTEIFTRSGWKKFSELKENDEVAYIKDMTNFIADFTQPISHFQKQYNGLMYGASGKRVDYLVTHHHRMFCKTKYEKFNGDNKFNIKLAEDIHNKSIYHLANMKFDFNIDKYNDTIILENKTSPSGKNCTTEFKRKDFCEFLGWYISEGSLSYWASNKKYKNGKSFSYKIQISQYKNVHPENCEKIEKLLDRMGLNWNYNTKQYTISNKSLYEYLIKLGKCNEKYIPKEILYESNLDDLRSLFTSLIDGDGSYLKNNNYVYYTTSKQLSDDISTLASLLGYHCSSPGVQRNGRKLPKYIVYIYSKENIELYVDKHQYYTEEYNGMIYCVEVPNGLLLVRRNGKQFWCGNTPWGDRIDIIINPIGIIGRMNVGQLYELYTGLISKEVGMFILKNKTSRAKVVDILKKSLGLLDKTNKKSYSVKLISAIEKMPEATFKKLISEIEQNKGFFPIVVPPFKSPTYQDILKVLKALGLKTGYKLTLPSYNTKTISDVPVGYMYYYKLEHIGDMKLHGRSTGPKTGKTQQPTGGKSRDGGQKMGEGDTYSLISYNATALLQEFFGPLSDDTKTKNEIIGEIIQQGSAQYKEPKSFPARDLLTSYFVSLMLEGK